MKFIFLISTTLFLSSIAFAGLCPEDSAKLCPGITGEELQKCMRKNVGQWSEACKAEVKAKLNENPEYRKLMAENKEKLEAIKSEKMQNIKKVKEAGNSTASTTSATSTVAATVAKTENKIAEIQNRYKVCREKTKELATKRDAEIKQIDQNQKADKTKRNAEFYKKFNDQRKQARDQYKKDREAIVECQKAKK